jgi:molybdopterin converting factor small subunit
MPEIRIPSPLRSYIGGQESVHLEASTINDALLNLITQYPEIKQQLFDPEGRLRAFVNLFLEGENVKDLRAGLFTKVSEESKLVILASIAGGANDF